MSPNRLLSPIRILLALLLGGALVTGPLSPPASASGPTTDCTLQAKTNPSTYGEPATFRFFAAARLPEDVPPSPSGLVTFFDGFPVLGHVLGTAVLLPELTKDNNDVEFTTSDLGVGDHVVYAVLVGPSGPCPIPPSVGQHVDPPPASPSSTAIDSSVNPSRFGQSVTFTAAVARQGGGAVAGTVQFRADGADVGGPVPVDATGHASVATGSLAVGTHAITASFTSANADTLGSDGSLAGGQVVQSADTHTGVTSSVNPSELGQSVTFTAQVAAVAPGAGNPGGTVQFSADGSPIGVPQGVDGSGRASVSTADLTVGTHTVTASFTSGDGRFNGSAGSVDQTVERVRTTLTYDGATTGDFHDPALLGATLTRTTGGTPVAGAVVHLAMGAETCDAMTDASGRATCSVTPQEAAGAATATATYDGDASTQPSTDSTTFTVTREQTTLDYTGDTVILNGGTAHASARLTEDDGAPALAGRSVVFTLGSGTSAQTCTGLTDATGTAACDIGSVAQPLGPGAVTAGFAQDAYYLASTDSADTILFAFPGRGGFVVGDRGTTTGAAVRFYDPSWNQVNSLSGGLAPSAFKGFATSPGNPPRCGGTFTYAAKPGNSGAPPATVPSYMGTLVTSKVTSAGSTITGTITRIVVVRTSSYGSLDQGGRGTVVAVVC